MSIRPDHLNITPEARQAERAASLERRVASLERSATGGAQRVNKHVTWSEGRPKTVVTTDPLNAGALLVTGTLEVPSDDSLILLYWNITARHQAGGRTNCWLLSDQVIAAGGSAQLLADFASSTYTRVGPLAFQTYASAGETILAPIVIDPDTYYGPSTLNLSLAITPQSGSGVVNVIDARLIALIV